MVTTSSLPNFEGYVYMRVSEALGVTSAKLWKQGVFDSYLGIDSRLHIDPALLRTTRIPDFTISKNRFEEYFSGVLLLAAEAKVGGVLERQAIERLVFPEIQIASLGHSKGSNKGYGVSPALARRLYLTAKEIIEAGVRDPAIFELAVVFEEDFGPDLISDMTLRVILEDVSNFNKRVCSNLFIATKNIKIGTKLITTALSEKANGSILLLPRSLLAVIPEATSYEDIDTVVSYNRELRERFNQMFGENWSNLVRRLRKRDLRRLFIENPAVLKDWLSAYKSKKPDAYDFDSDPLGEIVWDEIGKEFASEYKCTLSNPVSADELARVIGKITSQFKRLIEKNALCKHLYTDSDKQRPEKFAQLLFYAVADSYCKANNLDLSAEPNAGRGPVDFKISGGYNARATVEIKLSSNGGALDGILAQLPEYSLAEQSIYDCFVLLVVGPSKSKVNRIAAMRKKLIKDRKPVPDLVIINAYDAYNAPSASNLHWSESW
jgi:hypothetical protein